MAEIVPITFEIFLVPVVAPGWTPPRGSVRLGSVNVVPNDPNLGENVNTAVRDALQANTVQRVQDRTSELIYGEDGKPYLKPRPIRDNPQA